MSFLDLDERLIDLMDKVELVYSPIADIKEFPENVDVTLVEGAVANVDHVKLVEGDPGAQQDRRQLWRLRGDGQRHQPAQQAGRR